MSDSPELVFEFSANGKASGTTVTARIGDDVIAVDKLDITKTKSRAEYVDLVCRGRPGIETKRVAHLLMDQAAQFARRQSEVEEKPPTPDADVLLQKMPEHIRNEARAMLESKDLMARCYLDVAALGVAGEHDLVAAVYLIGTSRLLEEPSGAIVQAPSSTGKSYVVEKTATLFPPETVVHATAFTPNALFYMEPGSLRHKFVVAGERSRRVDDDSADATKALREMLLAAGFGNCASNGRMVGR